MPAHLVHGLSGTQAYKNVFKRRWVAEKIAAGLCRQCGKFPPMGVSLCRVCLDYKKQYHKRKGYVADLAWKKKHPDKVRQYRQKRAAMIKKELIARYGSACNCCGEPREDFLSLDHVDWRKGTLSAHREGRALWEWVYTHKPTTGFQLLCFNCNMAKGFLGRCPHQLESSNISARQTVA